MVSSACGGMLYATINIDLRYSQAIKFQGNYRLEKVADFLLPIPGLNFTIDLIPQIY